MRKSNNTVRGVVISSFHPEVPPSATPAIVRCTEIVGTILWAPSQGGRYLAGPMGFATAGRHPNLPLNVTVC